MKHFSMGIVFAMFSVLALLSVSITILSFSHHIFLARYHLWIMLVGMLVCLLYGFFVAYILFKQIHAQQKVSKHVVDVMLKFVSKDEKNVLLFLVEHGGKSTQAHIARLEGMGGVKALRTVQKLEQKGLISIRKEGKVRSVFLDSTILDIVGDTYRRCK